MTKRWLLYFSMLVAVAASAVAVAAPAHAATGVRETPDRTWNTNGTVFASELSADGDTLYIGGKFTVVRENPPGTAGRKINVNSVAAIDVATGEAIAAWNPKVTGGPATVRSLEVQGSGASERVFIGGSFTNVGGQPRQSLASVDATNGSVDSFAPQVLKGTNTSYVYGLLASDSKLYIGGQFNKVNGKGRLNLAAFDLATGALDPVWKPKVNNTDTSNKVRELEFAPDGATIFVAGRFTDVTGSDGTAGRRESLARLQTATGNLDPWKVADGVIGSPQDGWDLTVTPTMVYGGFGAGPNFAAAFRLSDATRVWQFGTVGNVQTVELSPDGSRLFLGGHFGTNVLEQNVCGNRPLSGLVSVNPATGSIFCDWVPQLSPSYQNGNGSWALTSTEDALWVGGGFTQVTGGNPPVTVDQSNTARFDYDAALEPNYAVPQVDLNGLQSGGLDATYYDNSDFTGTPLSRTDATVNFDWGNGSPDPSIGPDTFSARWTGQVEAPASGEYTFTTTSDDGVRLFVDGKTVVDNWGDHAPTDDSGTITLEAGRRYDIQLDFYENGGGATARLNWSYPGQARQVAPSTNLFFAGNTSYAATFTAGAGPTPIVDPAALTLTDADDTNLSSAKVTLTNRPDGTAERLSANAAGTPIAVSYDPQTGVLTLQGPATKAAFRQVLGTVSYDNTSPNPTAGDRAVTFVANDGSANSRAATSTVSVGAGN